MVLNFSNIITTQNNKTFNLKLKRIRIQKPLNLFLKLKPIKPSRILPTTSCIKPDSKCFNLNPSINFSPCIITVKENKISSKDSTRKILLSALSRGKD